MELDQHLRDETHPNPPPSNYRKIELQSPLDLTYLQDNLAKVALEKLNFVLPDNPSQSKPATVISLDGQKDTSSSAKGEDTTFEKDPLKEQVRELVSEFLQKTWHSAQQSLTLNGLDASSIPVPSTVTLSRTPQSNTAQSGTGESATIEEREGIHFTYSAFDPRLQHKLASLHGELEKLTAEVSKLRREAPKKAASTYASSLDKHMQTDEESYQNQQTQAQVQEANTQNHGLQLEPVREGWSTDLKEKYNGGVRSLGGLAGVSSSTGGNSASGIVRSDGKREPSLTETMGKAIRARDVVHEME